MSRLKLASLLPILLLIHGSQQEPQAQKLYPASNGCTIQITLPNISDGGAFVRQLTIAPSLDLMFNVSGISEQASIVLFQIHTYQYNVTLSYDEESLKKASGRSVFGSNIGLYVAGHSNIPITMYLRNDNLGAVDTLVVVTAYDARAPVPGGCNMEFGTEIAPYMKLNTRDDAIIIDMQPASLSTLLYPKFKCDGSAIKHKVYQVFLPERDFSTESYFSAIKSMLTVKDILTNGREMAASSRAPMRRVHSAFTGVGSVYVAVSTYKNYTSAYIPAVSYACNPVLYPDSCNVLTGVASRFVCAITFFLGLCMVFFCRGSSPMDGTVSLFLFGSVIGYALAKSASLSVEINLLLAMVTGLIVILPKFLKFTCTHSETTNYSQSYNQGPSATTIYVAGLLLACAVSLHLPDVILFSNSILYWSVFTSLVLAFSCIMFCMGRVASAIVGSALMVLPIDYFAPSCLKYIIVNIIRRAVVPDYDLASIHPPYQGADGGLTALWCILAIIYLCNSSVQNFEGPDVFIRNTFHRVTTRTRLVRFAPTQSYSTF